MVYILSHGEGLQSLIAVVCRELFARSYRVAVCVGFRSWSRFLAVSLQVT